MAKPETLTNVKLALRVSHSVLDADIMADVDACLDDLRVCGIIEPVETDPLIFNAIKLYCRSLYTDDTGKAAEWLRRYEALKGCLQLAEGYGWTEEAGADD